MAVIGGILSNKHNLSNTLIHQLLYLLMNILNGTASKFTTNQRDSTESATIITALSNLNISCIGWRSRNTRYRGIVDNLILAVNHYPIACQGFVNCFHNTIPGARTNNAICLWQIIQKLLTIALTKTACNNNGFALTLAWLLVFCHIQNCGNRLCLGRFYKGAGIYNQNICLCRIIYQLYTVLLNNAQHNLCIYKIFRASQTNKSCFQIYDSSLYIFSKFINYLFLPASPIYPATPAVFPLENQPID